MISEKEITQEACRLLGKNGLETVSTRYEDTDPFNSYQYHKLSHSRLVGQRFKKLASDLREEIPSLISPEDIVFGTANAKGHDRFIDWEPVSKIVEDIDGYEVMTMKRYSGPNEEKSAEEEILDMRMINEKLGREVFGDYHEAICLESYRVTIPGFSPEHKTVFQPNLKPETSIVARLTGLADIGSAGMNTERFLEDGDELFREEQLDILLMLTSPNSLMFTNSRVSDHVRGRMINWSNFQPNFARGRGELFDSDTEGLPEKAIKILKNHFDHFDDSYEATLSIAKKRESMTLQELIVDMGYTTKDTRKHLIQRQILNKI